MEALYKAYKDKAQFFLIYTREIHPSRSTSTGATGAQASRYSRGPAITQHTSMNDRIIAADKCMKGLKFTIPILLDDMDNTFTKTYSGMPAGTTVIDINGKIAYWNRGAPTGARPPLAEAALKKLLAAGGGPIPEKWAAVKMPRPKPAEKTKEAKAPATPKKAGAVGK